MLCVESDLILDVSIYLWVQMEQNIGISLQLDCIWWFSHDVVLRCIRMLVFPESLESLYMSIVESYDVYMYSMR
jgi:hypothetical protein